MDLRFAGKHAPLFGLAALAVCIVLARAALQSITIDEANIYLGYVTKSWPTQWYSADENHVLSTILERLTTTVFGVGQLTLRVPAILGAIVYVGAALWLCTLLTSRALLQWPLFFCLVFNPMVLDFLVAARGYGLAIGFLLAAFAVIAHTMLMPDRGGPADLRRKCVWISVLLALSFASTYSSALVCGAAMLLFFWWAAAQDQGPAAARYARTAVACFLPGLLVAWILCGSSLWNPRSRADLGVQSWWQVWQSLVAESFDDPNPELVNPGLMPLLRIIQPGLPYLVALAMALLLALRDSGPRNLRVLTRFFAGTAVIALLLHWIAFRTLHLGLPEGRHALYFVPLGTLMFGAALAARFHDAKRDLIRSGATAVLVIAAMYFAGCLRLSYFKEWRYDADTKQLYFLADDLRRHCGITDFVTDWRYVNPLNYYRAIYGNLALAEFFLFDGQQPPGDRKAYIIFYPTSEEFIHQQRLQVLFHSEGSGAAVAIRGCEPVAQVILPKF